MSGRYRVERIHGGVLNCGHRSGTFNVCVRLSQISGRDLSADEIVAEAVEAWPRRNDPATGLPAFIPGERWAAFCEEPEPAGIVDCELVTRLHVAGFKVHVVTRGNTPIAQGIDWVTAFRRRESGTHVLGRVNEAFYVVNEFDPLPQRVTADHHFIVPENTRVMEGDATIWVPKLSALKRATSLVAANPGWRVGARIST